MFIGLINMLREINCHMKIKAKMRNYRRLLRRNFFHSEIIFESTELFVRRTGGKLFLHGDMTNKWMSRSNYFTIINILHYVLSTWRPFGN